MPPAPGSAPPVLDFGGHAVLDPGTGATVGLTDGSASRAFVMPSRVDGRPARSSDPLADDQDRHPLLWMRAEGDAGPSGIRG
ncbi:MULTISPECIES: hypothetical protein [unclassified Streptomyces]|uniref:hypothetical protein n=1 Tax=unclassified Streptomyces TaxID=2593676 RepID=UPI00093DFC1A|nr:hypothetical protein [Streptomyces sp. CB02058]OKI92677.1 hypothetical protein AMK10_23435 [Streptomyces sp. CB02058]